MNLENKSVDLAIKKEEGAAESSSSNSSETFKPITMDASVSVKSNPFSTELNVDGNSGNKILTYNLLGVVPQSAKITRYDVKLYGNIGSSPKLVKSGMDLGSTGHIVDSKYSNLNLVVDLDYEHKDGYYMSSGNFQLLDGEQSLELDTVQKVSTINSIDQLYEFFNKRLAAIESKLGL